MKTAIYVRTAQENEVEIKAQIEFCKDILNNEEFVIDTVLGNLKVKGSDLTMQQLDIDKGQIWIEGKIDLIEYMDKTELTMRYMS